MATSKYGVVVGIAGDHNAAVLRWAAEEAALREQLVTLLHVEPEVPPPMPELARTREELHRGAEQLAARAMEDYAKVVRELDIQPPRCLSLVRRGLPADVLTDLSMDAELVVLGHRRQSALRRIVTGSTAVATASRVHCPMISVPEQPPQERAGLAVSATPGRVTVGVDEAGGPKPVLEAAFDMAARHGKSLRLVHAWRLDRAYDEIIADRLIESWRLQVEEQLDTAAKQASAEHPTVSVDHQVRYDWPADVLSELAEASWLVVVGRHGGRPHLTHRIGSLARTMVRHAACPVMVVPLAPDS